MGDEVEGVRIPRSVAGEALAGVLFMYLGRTCNGAVAGQLAADLATRVDVALAPYGIGSDAQREHVERVVREFAAEWSNARPQASSAMIRQLVDLTEGSLAGTSARLNALKTASTDEPDGPIH